MKPKLHISGAGNVVVPAYLTLQKMGYNVRFEKPVSDEETWIAESDAVRLSANDVIMLLGLATVAQARGESWKASDAEIQDFLKKFGYEKPVV
jgi:hypothetical protein